MNASEKKLKLDELAATINVCKKCRLCEKALNAVPGAGNPDSEIIFIGEAPGATEDQQGVPFVGRAGKLLEFLLKQIGKKRDDVWIGNIIKHRPPANRDPLEDELNACKPYLTTQIEILNPKLIVTLGRFSMNYFLPNTKISLARGKLHKTQSYQIYPVYHPAAALRNSNMKNLLILDFLKIPAILEDRFNEEIIDLSLKPLEISNLPTKKDERAANTTEKKTEQIGLF